MKIPVEQLHAVSRRLSSGSDDVEQQLQSMESEVNRLVDAEWDAAGSDAFRELFDQWRRGAAQVKEALDGISQMLASSASDYDERDQEVARKLQAR